ncbi:MAG: response regulator transcription factor [Spirosomataceae bacterium]
MQQNKKILIVEDDRRIAETLKKGLLKMEYDVENAFDGNLGLRMAIQSKFDLIILDINLPQMNGYEVCKRIREEKPFLPVLMLTALGEVEDKLEGFDVGVDDYMVKPFDFRELFARVSSLLRRTDFEPQPTGRILRVANLEVNIDSKKVFRDNKLINLTAREFDFLEYLIRNKGRVLSKMDIAEKIWDLNFDTSLNVIEVYVNFLRKKIDKGFEPKLIHTKLGMGYVLTDNP